MQKRLSGWTDTDLSPKGVQQTKLLADHVNRAHGHAAAVYASPLMRARKTGEAIATLTGHAVELLDDLREMHFGDLEGRPMEELREMYSHVLHADEDDEAHDFGWPNGETRQEFSTRVLRVMNHIAAAHPGQTACVVTHGGVIAVFLTIIHNEPASRWRRWVGPNASLTEVLWDPGTRHGELLRNGDAAHLAELTASETATAKNA